MVSGTGSSAEYDIRIFPLGGSGGQRLSVQVAFVFMDLGLLLLAGPASRAGASHWAQESSVVQPVLVWPRTN